MTKITFRPKKIGELTWTVSYAELASNEAEAIKRAFELDRLLAKGSVEPEGTEARVCGDIAARQQMGIAKYGKTVEGNPLSLRQWLLHAYEETLDQAIYLRRSIEEIDKEKVGQ